MVSSCCVWGCTARRKTGSSLTFFSFPSAKQRPAQRQKWIAAIKRTTDSSKARRQTNGAVASGSGTQWEPRKGHYVCPRHFLTGEPSMEPTHPDYVPSLHLTPKARASSPESTAKKQSNKIARYNRYWKRRAVFAHPAVPSQEPSASTTVPNSSLGSSASTTTVLNSSLGPSASTTVPNSSLESSASTTTIQNSTTILESLLEPSASTTTIQNSSLEPSAYTTTIQNSTTILESLLEPSASTTTIQNSSLEPSVSTIKKKKFIIIQNSSLGPSAPTTIIQNSSLGPSVSTTTEPNPTQDTDSRSDNPSCTNTSCLCTCSSVLNRVAKLEAKWKSLELEIALLRKERDSLKSQLTPATFKQHMKYGYNVRPARATTEKLDLRPPHRPPEKKRTRKVYTELPPEERNAVLTELARVPPSAVVLYSIPVQAKNTNDTSVTREADTAATSDTDTASEGEENDLPRRSL